MSRCIALGLMIGGLFTAASLCESTARADDAKLVHSFDRIQLSNVFFAEGATCGDLNGDGKKDVVAGPFWYAGPDFQQRYAFYPAKPFSIEGYSDNFFAFVDDINGDEKNDILIIGFPGKEAFWYENTGKFDAHWPRHLAFAVVDNESPTYTDITGDGRPELVFHTEGRLGYAGPNPDDPTQPWEFHAVSPKRNYQRFTHGLGVGDVNGDGRLDILEKNGWWEHSADGKLWKLHQAPFGQQGGAQMYAYDLDGDGDNDVITSLSAHRWGLSWFENVKQDGEITFVEHRIMGEKPEHNPYGVAFSQLHAVELVDMDGDGVKDIVTGKRYWAHQGHDPGSDKPPVNYWFKTVRTDDGVQFLPYLIDDKSGVGTQVVVSDVDGNDLPDLVVGNKLGTFVLIHHARPASADEWEKAQPQPYTPPKVQAAAPPAGWPVGKLPTSDDGRPLNLDFETGDLRDWVATGDAFGQQPIQGDTVKPRRGDMESGHLGAYWIGGFEVHGDRPQGTLTSASFKVTAPYASFLIGGGSSTKTRVEIVRGDRNQPVFIAQGRNDEHMRPVVVDLKNYQGREIYVRLVDEHSGGWGHINFDEFRFHAEKPAFPGVSDTPSEPTFTHSGLAAQAAAEAMTVPEGFRVSVCAAEPDVKQPIAFALDDRGRVWVVEAYSYPIKRPQDQAKDRILIFEDADGDGRFDSRKVFYEGLNLVSGLEVGHGGVWVGQAPELLFIPDRNGDDTPDGPPEVLLDGWGLQDTHETLNAFIWGPDGWLYGCHGVFTHSRVGKPGTPDDQRIPLNAGIWRYHPTRHEFEVFAHGTSNPWGVDFDDYGQSFLTCCVIPHLFHVIQGARYERQAGQHFNPYTYDDIKTVAVHRHWKGNQWNNADRASSDDVGGGHAHAGAMVYLGDAWPEKYRGSLLMNNIHGARLNQDVLSRKGSGYVGNFAPDFLLANDKWSQILNMRYGPDGQVYMIDWYDMNECHRREIETHDRSNGRIYKISYGETRPVKVDLQQLSSEELVDLQLHKNDWYVRHARRILHERGENPAVHSSLAKLAFQHEDPTRRVRALWALHLTGGLSEARIALGLANDSEYVRGWTIQLALDGRSPSPTTLGRFMHMAASDPSPLVRLYLASALQRLSHEQRWPLLEKLLAHADDAGDHNLPLMYWYALEPLVPADPQRALQLASSSRIDLVKRYTLRRIADIGSAEALAFLVEALGRARAADEQLTYLQAIREALKGRRQFPMPEPWSAVAKGLHESNSADVRDQARALSVTFGDPAALAATRAIAADASADAAQRKEAIDSLLGAGDQELAPTLQALVADRAVRREAIRGLAQYADPHTPQVILGQYATFSLAEKRDALNTLASRAGYADALLTALVEEKVPRTDLTADIIRQMGNLKDDALRKRLSDVWGVVRETAEDKQKQIAAYQKLITARGKQPDVMLGRAVYAKTCQQCHKLFGTGGTVGPELTGSNRANLEYLLSNVIDPSAVMAKEYQPSIITTIQGRTITGIVKAEDAESVSIVTANETVIIPKDEIDERVVSEKSMMPDNQWDQMKPHEIRSLVAYLAGSSQVPLRATAENAITFFNGLNLDGWQGNTELWSVENGEIVGKSPGIKQNEFLKSEMVVSDFELTLEMKLTPNTENSGIQFRSEVLPNGLVKGYQADAGQGWWGKLYEEHGRTLLWKKPGDQHVKPNEWNHYRILAVGDHIRTYINGHPCVDMHDPPGAREGIIALQIHSGGAMEVRFRNVKLTVDPQSAPAQTPAAQAGSGQTSGGP